MSLPDKTDVLIVGGGLAGLSLAHQLNQGGVDFQLVETRHRFGGRIRTEWINNLPLDLGPTWFWPGQPHIEALVRELGLKTFEQFASGDLLYEDERGQVIRGQGYASMAGSLRLTGGLDTLISALVAKLPAERIHLGATVKAIGPTGAQVSIATSSATVQSKHVAIALPPRLAQASIAFEPPLTETTRTAMRGIPTWMASQAKAVATYEQPFWRDAGLSGDAMSRTGPLVEVHDASPAEPGGGALFGFIGVSPDQRLNQDKLEAAIRDQLLRLFGNQAMPLTLRIEDWAKQAATSTPDDRRLAAAHPDGGIPPSLADLGPGGIHFCGSEVAPNFAGYVEGAVEAASLLARQLTHR